MAIAFIMPNIGFSQKKSDDNLVNYFGSIRADLYRYACDVLNVNDDSLTAKIDTVSLTDFKKAIISDTDSAHFDFLPHLKRIIKFSNSIEGKDFVDDYKGLFSTIDSICQYLSDSASHQSDSIEAKRIDFHNQLAIAAIEHNAFQVTKIDTFYAKTRFEDLFANGFYVRKFPRVFKKKAEKATKEEPKISSEGTLVPEENIVCQEVIIQENNQNDDHKSTHKNTHDIWISLRDFIKYIILFLLLLGIGYVYYYFRIKKKNTNSITFPLTHPMSEGAGSDEKDCGNIGGVVLPPTQPEKPKENAFKETQNMEEKKDHCFIFDDSAISIIGASVIGNNHVSMNLPCQDCCGYESLGHGWGIAVTSDGAGSAEHSETGSKIVVARAIEYFKHILASKGWITQNYIPTDAEWTQTAYNVINAVYGDMKAFADAKSWNVKSLNATIIAVIHAPIGLLACHVGDGRSGYRDVAGEWKSIITPHKGEEANQTIFVTSNFWDIQNYVMSGVMVPECRVIKEKVTAFTLMSDGCESNSWRYNQQNEFGNFFDPNLPYPNFFEPLVKQLKDMHDANVASDERLDSWIKFLKSGENFAKEPDDKTMILGLALT